MTRNTFCIILVIIFLTSCQQRKTVDHIYRYYWGEKDGYKVWIIDGYTVRQNIYNEFLYGGNEQRYPFVPKGEIWIDHAISAEEFDLTLAHELNERHLMARYGWSYDRAHDSSLQLEVRLRRHWDTLCRQHEASLPLMVAKDRDGLKEIKDIPDSIRLQNIYRVPMGTRDGISIWVVDGYRVRANIFPDFGQSGDDLVYKFIPPKEIWIDGQMSCEETEYSVTLELLERSLLSKGFTWGRSYDSAINSNTRARFAMEKTLRRMPAVVLPDSITRTIGTKDEGR